MSDWKGIVKSGWHPEKEGTSLRGQVVSRIYPSIHPSIHIYTPFQVFKTRDDCSYIRRLISPTTGNQKGLIHRGDKSSSSPTSSSSNRSPPPISSLRDPSSFAPPPKHVGYRHGSPGGTAAQHQPESPDRQQTYGSTQEPAPEPRPYRVDTTGLSTSHLPPPPARRDDANGAPPPPYTAAKPPSLPPRLPPRSNNASPVHAPSPTSATANAGYLNQGAISRLGAAGISVPGLGIGKSSASSASPPPPASTNTTNNTSSNSLTDRFSRLSIPSSSSSSSSSSQRGTSTPAPEKGTTWAEKQAALRTASSFHRDPSSVSFADARAAAGTANNFRQRHGEQVAAGARAAHRVDQRFGVSERALAAGAGGSGGGAGGQGGAGGGGTSPMAQIQGVLAAKKKKPPPPPPAKKPSLAGMNDRGDTPPPVPMASRPKF
ncbi:hypothetical protein F5B20DRAFT_434852 [Whalleya microplaca]|nr:hypothetical protein F5B20DRAFT_434852 [Whalleya microplaca]